MKRILAVGCATVLALVAMDTNQVVKTPSGLSVKRGQALAADMPMPPPPLSSRQSARAKRPSARARANIPSRRL